MNEYSLIIMARIVDETKIERIKEATIEMVVSKGYGGASISEITRLAGVAEGYLYRYYKSKSELVNDLLYQSLNEVADKLEKSLDSEHSIKEILGQLIRMLFESANKHPEKIKFLYVLMNDYNFKIQEGQINRIHGLTKRVMDIGHASGEISKLIDEEEIYLLGVNYPIQFINLRLKGFFKQATIGEPEIDKVLRVCLNSIKSYNYEG
jgi:TetR/AcrR family transcriptional regulator, repressor of fatR-cypB operon